MLERKFVPGRHLLTLLFKILLFCMIYMLWLHQVLALDYPNSIIEVDSKRDANTRVWEYTRLVDDINNLSDGYYSRLIEEKTYVYEKADNLHYNAGSNEQPIWKETLIEIEESNDSRYAYQVVEGRHKVWFPYDLKQGNIKYQVGGVILRSRPSIIGYRNVFTGKFEQVAAVVSSVPQVSGNVITYPDTFANVSVDLRYIYTRSSFEQQIIIKQPLASPELFGLRSEEAELVILTEWQDIENTASSPVQIEEGGRVVFSVPGESRILVEVGEEISLYQNLRFVNVREDSSKDELLFWFADSVFYEAGTEGEREERAKRQFVQWNGITCFSETIACEFLADAYYPVAAGYLCRSGGITSNEVWREGNTYYLVDNITVSNASLLIEGGAVLKYDVIGPYGNGVTLSAEENGQIVTAGNRNNYVVITSVNDDEAGETIYGKSIGFPQPGDYGSAFLLAENSSRRSIIQYCRIRFAQCGIEAKVSLDNPISGNICEGFSFAAICQEKTKGGKIEIVNNLIRGEDYYFSLGNTGILITDVENADCYIKKNTIDRCFTGVLITYVRNTETSINITGNILTANEYGIYSDLQEDNNIILTIDNNAFFGNYYRLFPADLPDTNSLSLSFSPYSGTENGYYQLNDWAGGGFECRSLGWEAAVGGNNSEEVLHYSDFSEFIPEEEKLESYPVKQDEWYGLNNDLIVDEEEEKAELVSPGIYFQPEESSAGTDDFNVVDEPETEIVEEDATLPGTVNAVTEPTIMYCLESGANEPIIPHYWSGGGEEEIGLTVDSEILYKLGYVEEKEYLPGKTESETDRIVHQSYFKTEGGEILPSKTVWQYYVDAEGQLKLKRTVYRRETIIEFREGEERRMMKYLPPLEEVWEKLYLRWKDVKLESIVPYRSQGPDIMTSASAYLIIPAAYSSAGDDISRKNGLQIIENGDLQNILPDLGGKWKYRGEMQGNVSVDLIYNVGKLSREEDELTSAFLAVGEEGFEKRAGYFALTGRGGTSQGFNYNGQIIFNVSDDLRLGEPNEFKLALRKGSAVSCCPDGAIDYRCDGEDSIYLSDGEPYPQLQLYVNGVIMEIIGAEESSSPKSGEIVYTIMATLRGEDDPEREEQVTFSLNETYPGITVSQTTRLMHVNQPVYFTIISDGSRGISSQNIFLLAKIDEKISGLLPLFP